jgi:hypothetical protein
MNEELVSELGVEIPEEEVEEEVAVEKLYDLTKVEAAYCAMQKEDLTKMTRVSYDKYLWLEQILVAAGVVGEQAWEREFAAAE